jgi:hypothetical protein
LTLIDLGRKETFYLMLLLVFPDASAYTGVEGLQQQMKAIRYAAASSQERIRQSSGMCSKYSTYISCTLLLNVAY